MTLIEVHLYIKQKNTVTQGVTHSC